MHRVVFDTYCEVSEGVCCVRRPVVDRRCPEAAAFFVVRAVVLPEAFEARLTLDFVEPAARDEDLRGVDAVFEGELGDDSEVDSEVEGDLTPTFTSTQFTHLDVVRRIV